MTPQTMSFIFGALLLAVAILGGGFEIKELKVSKATTSVRIISGIAGLIFTGFGFWQPTALPETDRGNVKMSQREDSKDRLGGDYFAFDVKIDHIEDCETACKADGKCAAWTYVKPGYRGPQAKCYLKSVVPALSDNPILRFREETSLVQANCCSSPSSGTRTRSFVAADPETLPDGRRSLAVEVV
jgi:hypothetical protein